MRASRPIPLCTLALALSASLFVPARAGGEMPPDTLRIAGSGYTMPLFTSVWVDAFNARDGFQVELDRRGTATGPPALLSGRAQIASMTRPMTASELEAFRRTRGREPLAIPVAADALAVFVHRDNPLAALTLEQVDAIFSQTRECGGGGELLTWSDLGLSGEYTERSIGIYGRRTGSGTGDFFRNTALCKGRLKESLRVAPGARSSVLAVAEDRFGIGFASRADIVDGAKPIALGLGRGSPFVKAIPREVYSGAYPLARLLYFYVNAEADDRSDDLREFVAYALSPEGQEAVKAAGYLALPEEVAREALARLP